MMGMDTTPEEYHKAERRLRALLFGDGVNTPGLVRGEERRRVVAADLRRMRNAYQAVLLQSEEWREQKVEAGGAELHDELRRIAAEKRHTHPDGNLELRRTPEEHARDWDAQRQTRLTPEQRRAEVARLLEAGRTAGQIAVALGVSVTTIRRDRKTVPPGRDGSRA